jgi:cyclic pyranopterin phosphate synthase
MVDVSPKPTTARRAVAQALVHMRPETLQRLEDAPKGSVLGAARIAGIQAAKRTSELIPLCHMLPLTSVEIDIFPDVILGQLQVVATVRAVDRTGVEMEALVAVSIASLTVYDMLKAIDREIVVADVRLLEKDGGASGSWKPGGGASE